MSGGRNVTPYKQYLCGFAALNELKPLKSYLPVFRVITDVKIMCNYSKIRCKMLAVMKIEVIL